MKQIILLFTAISCAFVSYAQNPKKGKLKNDAAGKMTGMKEVWTIYTNQDTIVHVKRLLSSDAGLSLLSYNINTSKPEAARQTFVSRQSIKNEAEASAIKAKSTTFNWKPYKPANVLFLQIEFSMKTGTQADYLFLREEIEPKIEAALKEKQLGEWFASDLGMGANTLFVVSDFDLAFPVVLNVLSKEGLEKKTIIGRRIDTGEDDWFYEVVYPANFNGVFDTQ